MVWTSFFQIILLTFFGNLNWLHILLTAKHDKVNSWSNGNLEVKALSVAWENAIEQRTVALRAQEQYLGACTC